MVIKVVTMISHAIRNSELEFFFFLFFFCGGCGVYITLSKNLAKQTAAQEAKRAKIVVEKTEQDKRSAKLIAQTSHSSH